MIPRNGTSRIVFWVVIITFLAVWLRIGWVLFYPYEPLVIHSHKILNEGKQVKAGGIVLLESIFTKNTDAQAYVTRQMIGKKFLYYIPPYYATNPISKERINVFSIFVPSYAEPDTYRFFTTYTYSVSNFPKRSVTIPAWSEEFEVVK